MHCGRQAVSWKPTFVAVAVIMGVLNASAAFAQASASCTISVSSMNFGSYNVFSGSDLDSTATITYNCNPQARPISITLGKGQSSTYSPRTMNQGSERLNYNFYLDAGRTSVWGDGTGGTGIYSQANPPNNQDVNVTIYGRVPASQDIAAGSYSDTVSATINF